jgi:hypothetical protein
MRKEFLETLIKKFPSNYELGAAIRYYYNLLKLEGYTISTIEEMVLSKNFQL